ncbi:MAG TPA: outer membrane beta-barrel protein [Xanthobacteraceae bacterium]
MKLSTPVRGAELGSVVLFTAALAGTVSAADLPVRMPHTYAPIPSWTGCYLGGYVGGAWKGGDASFGDLGNSLFAAYSGGIITPRREGQHSWYVDMDSSFPFGATVGCNWQPVGTALVLGIEGEAGYVKLEGSGYDPLVSSVLPVAAVRTTTDVLGTAKIGNWYGMVTGRLGYAWGPVLIYFKGGAAFVPTSASILDQCSGGGCGNWLIGTSGSQTKSTATLGGGLEWAFNYNWSVKAEYMYVGFAVHDTLTQCAVATTSTGAAVPGGQFCFATDFGGIHTAKIGLNYRFGP